MIDENNGCVTKSKLTITVKTLSKYNDRSMVAAKQRSKQRNKQTNKQTNRLRLTKSDKHLGRNHTKGRKGLTYK